jgi:hypothetical protein
VAVFSPGRLCIVGLAILLAPAPTEGQPYSWTTLSFFTRPVCCPNPILSVRNLATNAEVARLRLPEAGWTAGQFSADGRYYFLTSRSGVIRFDAQTLEFLGRFGDPVNVSRMWVSPNGRWIHLAVVHPAGTGYRIIDAATGGTILDECCPPNAIAFSDDGTTRFVARRQTSADAWSLAAFLDEPNAVAHWTTTVTLPGTSGFLSTSGDSISFASESGVVILDVGTGTEVRRATSAELCGGTCSPITGLAQRGSDLLVQVGVSSLLRVDVATLTRRASASLNNLLTTQTTVALSPDGTVYWFDNDFGAHGATAAVSVHELQTLERIRQFPRSDGNTGRVSIGTQPPCGGACIPIAVTISPESPLLDPGAGSGSVTVSVEPPTAVWAAEGFDGWLTLDRRFGLGTGTIGYSYTLGDSYQSRVATWYIAGRPVQFRQPINAAIPGAPGAVTATVSNFRVQLGWLPNSTGGSAGYYLIDARPAEAQSGVTLRTPGAYPAHELSGVPRGRYVVRVRAENSFGIGPPSTETEVIVGGDGGVPPAPPQNLVSSLSGNRLTLTWDPPATGPSLQHYHLDVGRNSGEANIVSIPLPTLNRTFTHDGVPSGIYFVRVRAVNAAGPGDASNEVLVNVGNLPMPPGAPRLLSSTVTGSTVALMWQPPADGEAPTTYVIEAGSWHGLANLATLQVPGSNTAFTISNVPAGSYYVRVRARNAAAIGGASNEILVVVP